MKLQGIEKREYQEKIAETCLKGNTLVVLPTGLGKTIIALLVAARLLEQNPGKKVLILAPTKPLVEQHLQACKKFLGENIAVAVSGKLRPEKRQQLYSKYRIIVATPQTARNDLLAGRLNPADFCLVVFDECHRATGNYPYVYIARQLVLANPDIRIVGLTASPADSPEKLRELLKNLCIRYIEFRTEDSPDVKKYIKGVKVEWKFVALPQQHKQCIELLKAVEKDLKAKLRELGYSAEKLSSKALLELKKHILRDFVQRPGEANKALLLVLALLKLLHLRQLLESQGTAQAREYLRGLLQQERLARAVQYLLTDERFRQAHQLMQQLQLAGYIHQKFYEVLNILKEKNFRKAIIFAQLRSTAKLLKEFLEKEGFSAVYFAGHSEYSQEQQLKLLQEFKDSARVLVATSVAEEGLDIPEVDLVIFYEPVPSALRAIQRRGRTGRRIPGQVVVLVAEGIDSQYYWACKAKEKRLKQLLQQLKEFLPSEETQQQQEFSGKIIIDDREARSPVAERLKELGIQVEIRRLEVGDYVLGDIVVERKRAEDFARSLLDGRLFEQTRQLVEGAVKPVIIVEGDVLAAGLRPEPLYGALLSLLLDFGIPVLFTSSPAETALLLALLARRLQKEKREERIVARKPKSLPSIQERVLAQFPGIGIKKARALLSRFGCLKNVFLADYPALAEILGETTARKFKEVLEHKYSEKKNGEK
ncbi:MAG: DEAD/DEAH box helicase family protein [bacterium]|nr:DEAD/DEAH box helicase family protein [bacterium]